MRGAPASRPRDPWRVGEPNLAEMLSDPILLAVMARDGVSSAELWAVVERVRRGIGAGLCRLDLAA